MTDDLTDVRVVPAEVAGGIIAEARDTIAALEKELEELSADHTDTSATTDPERMDPAGMDPERMDAATEFLLDQAQALITDAEEYRDRVLDLARSRATAILDAARSTHPQ